MALLVAATDSHQWVSQFKTAICVVAAIVSLVCIVGIQNFMSKKFVFYKLLQHKIVLQFETKPPTRLCGVPCPAFVPAQYLDAAAVTLIVLVLGTLIIGLAMFGYSATDGTTGVKSIRWAKLGGTAGASLAAGILCLTPCHDAQLRFIIHEPVVFARMAHAVYDSAATFTLTCLHVASICFHKQCYARHILTTFDD